MKSLPRWKVLAWSALLLLPLAGCSKPSAAPHRADKAAAHPNAIHVEVAARTGATPIQRADRPIVLLVSDYKDARPGQPGRRLGDIRATVFDMHGTELYLGRDVPDLVGAAVRAQLAADGFRLAGQPGEAHDFRLGGVINAFSLNIAGRDELHLLVETTLQDAQSGQVIWSGLVSEKTDRYAGVTGNTRGSITEYLAAGVAELAVKSSASVRDGLARSYSQTVTTSRFPSTSTVPGVTNLQPAVDREPPPKAAPPAADRATAPAASGAATGTLSVTTLPVRAKVYIGDVYYGLTPLKLELEPGVHLFRFRLDGYKPVSEKVAIRRGATTELEVKFEK